MFLYLAINLGSILIPFVYSFEKRMNYIRYWKSIFLSIALVAIPFLIWDIFFTKMGVWGFNPAYYLGFTILGLPIEEILFFFCIPYASIFTHYALMYFFPKLSLSQLLTKLLTILLFITAVVIAYNNKDKWYTVVNFSVFAAVMLFALFNRAPHLNRFFISFLVILIPFLVVNGILTGSFIQDEVVWYNNDENLGIRFGTIPVEDFFYAFSMLYLPIIINEKIKFVFLKKK